ncbi:MAG: hypothetical protein ACJA0Q_000245 [Saprospiraceae bacterium]|jgi:hypothetical protein
MKNFLTLFCVFVCILLTAQTVPSSIANWKNNAKGAYSIIHDDYGNSGVDGIWQYADTIASNRGLKFTFGAISGDCEEARNINGYSSPYDYAKNVMMAQHDHEIINHSHTHTCAVARGWSPCGATGWGEMVGSPMWNTELNTSHTSIIAGTGFQPRYFIYPYDQFTDAANAELYSKGYIGSRTGWHADGIHTPFYKNGYEANDENLFKPDASGFFRTSVQVFDNIDQGNSESGQTAELNSVADNAIANNEWGNRELHNVGAGGWGSVLVTAYRDHLNYVQSKVSSGDLWMPTVSEALTYQIQKLVYTPVGNYDGGTKKITVTFTEDHSSITADVGTYLGALTIKTPVTIMLDVSAYVGLIDFTKAVVKQGATNIDAFTLDGNTFFVNLYPSDGSFTIEEDIPMSSFTVANHDEFSLYPNPANDVIYVRGEVNKISVFSSAGLELMVSNNNQVDLSALSSGVYFIRINNTSSLKKFVKL